MAKDRIIIHFQCTDCGARNYSTRLSKKRVQGKLQLRKYCSKCRKHHVHKETK